VIIPDGTREFQNVYRVRAESWTRTLEDIGVPKRYQAVSRDVEIHPAALPWRGEPSFLTFLGLTDSGKTWQATRLAGELRCRGWRVKWFCWSVALQTVLSEIGTDQDGRMLRTLMETDTIVLDDFLSERGSDFNIDKASLILRYRYDKCLPTIYTSNSMDESLELPGLHTLYQQEPRLGRRIKDGLVITLTEGGV
jgi:DNA replication protein DnaC